MNCPNCQTPVQVDDLFCNNCGQKLSPNLQGAAPAMPSTIGQDELAEPLTRLGAQLIDIGLYLACYIFYGIGVLLVWLFDSAFFIFLGNILAGLSSLALVIYQLYLLSTTGQTLGKRWVNIKIVRIDTKKNGGFVSNVLVRGFLNGLLGIGVCYILVDVLFIFRQDRRCIHDLIADTRVVKN